MRSRKSPGFVFREKKSKFHQLSTPIGCVSPWVRVRCELCRKGADTELRITNQGAAKIISLIVNGSGSIPFDPVLGPGFLLFFLFLDDGLSDRSSSYEVSSVVVACKRMGCSQG